MPPFGPRVGLSDGEQPSIIEQRLLDACRDEGVHCASTRAAMVAERQRGRLAHGNATYAITNGHLNDTGNAIVASLAWSMIDRSVTSVFHGALH